MEETIIKKEDKILFHKIGGIHNDILIDLTFLVGKNKAEEVYNLEISEKGKGVAVIHEIFPQSYMPYKEG